MISTKVHKQNAKIQISHIFLIFTIKTVVLNYPTEAIKTKCTNTDDFFFSSPGSQCGMYYKCNSKGQKEIRECSRGLKFDFYKQNCSHSPGCVEPTCIGRANGVYQDTTHACMRFFTCYAGQLTSVDNCPSKYLHNGQKCVQQNQVSCNARSFTSSTKSFANDRRCGNRLEGGLYSSGDNCSEYIECQSGEVTDIRSCPYDYAFDVSSQQCLPKHSVANCSDSLSTKIVVIPEESFCRNKVDGPIADPTSKDCGSYIMCKAGKYDGPRRCGNQAVFNGESCVPSPLHECSLSKRHVDMRALDQCNNKPNGYLAYPQHGCTSYARCMSQRIVEVGVCPAGQYFDMEVGKCIYERILERRRCFDRGISAECDGRVDGYYVDANCDTYFYCHSGYKIEYKCLPSKVFNGQACVTKSEYKCPKAENDNFCNFRSDGYYKDKSDGCRAYAYCSNGHKITYLCEPGHVFDNRHKKCVRKELFASNHCSSDHICYGKSDGYHVDIQSNCRSYIYCINYEKITQITCRDGKVFNGQKCVAPREYACPSLFNRRQTNCVPRKCLRQCESNGFYADLNSGCRDFYICINGKSSKTSCQMGMRFNGEICIAEDKFTCPVLCTHKHEVEGECPLGGRVA